MKLAIFLCIFFFINYANAFNEEDKSKIDNFISGVLQCTKGPGLSFALVEKNQVLMSRGYGYANTETKQPVTSKTKFAIASLSKAFGSTLLAKVLSKQTEYTWDTPVRQILGDKFYLYNGYETNKTTLRDLMAHKMGVARHDLLFAMKPFTRPELVQRVRFIRPIHEFRTKYEYNNNMQVVAGYAAEVIENKDWADILRDDILIPLGMSDTALIHTSAPNYDGFATFYFTDENDDPVVKVPYEAFGGLSEVAGPAGGLASNADDMVKWMNFHLSGGQNSTGDQVVDEANLQRTKESEIVTNDDIDARFIKPNSPATDVQDRYALSWNNGFYRGYPRVMHTGSVFGCVSRLSLLPTQQIGVFSSINSIPSATADRLIHQYVLDITLGVTPWLTVEAACNITNSEDQQNSYYNSDNPDTLQLLPKQHSNNNAEVAQRPLSDYAGVYGNFAYSNMTVTLSTSGTTLDLSYGALGRFILTATQNADEFYTEGVGAFSFGSIGFITFESSNNSTVDLMNVPNVEFKDPPVFKRDLKLASAPPPPTDNC